MGQELFVYKAKGEESMNQLLKDIQNYWTNRAEGYSQVNLEELAGEKWPEWLAVIEEHMPNKPKHMIRILDIGTGPGFFSIILSRAGYQMTAIDYTEEMLQKAKKNAGILAEQIHWFQMDAQDLEFPSNTFDMIVSRNVTWNLEHPEKAYSEWMRVLKPGGVLLNFDANWYHHLFDEEKRAAYEADREKVSNLGLEDDYLSTDIEAMEAIARQVPLSRIQRPEWDRRILGDLNGMQIETDHHIWQRVWCDAEKVNNGSTPMFMVSCSKPLMQQAEIRIPRAAVI